MIRPSCYNIPEGKSEKEALPDELLELLANIFQGVTNAFGDNATLYRLDIGRVYESVQSGDLVVAGQFVDRSDGEIFNFEINQGTNKVGYKSTGDFLDRNALSLFLGEEAGSGDPDDSNSEASESGPYPFDLLLQAINEEGSEAYQSPFGSKLRKDLDYLGALSALMYHAGATIEAQPLYTGLHSYAIKYALGGLRLFSQSIGPIQGSEAGQAADAWVDDHGLDFAAAVVKEFSSRRCVHFQECIQSEDQKGIQELNDLVEEAIGMAMATTTDLIISVVEVDDYQAGDVQATLASAIEEYCPIDNSEGYNAVDNARQLSAEWQEVVSRSGCVEDLSMQALGLPSAKNIPSEQSGSQEQPAEPPQDSGPNEVNTLAGERIFYVNVGEGPSRNWDDCRQFGFLAAGGGRKWSKQLEKIQIGDTVIAYLKGYGYVGIGRVTSTTTPATKFTVNGVSIKELPLINDTIRSIKRFSKENGEYLIGVDWVVQVSRDRAAWEANHGLYTTAHVCASLGNQKPTIDFVYSRLLGARGVGVETLGRPAAMTAAHNDSNEFMYSSSGESVMDGGLTDLAQPLSAQRALDWLQLALVKAAEQEVDTDDVFEDLVGCEWESVDEFLDFFVEISTQIARSATQETYEESAEVFGSSINYGLSLDSPYFRLWEQAYQTQSPRLADPISISDWDGEIVPEIEEISLVMMMPLAAAYEEPIFAALRNRLYSSLTEAQEEFLGYVAASLAPGYFDGSIPLEILYIPSSQILCEILEDWTQYRDLWLPHNLEEFLSSADFEKHANDAVKARIIRVLKGEDPNNPDEWQSFKDEYWSDERLSHANQKCE